jgi:hypothetical protein
MNWKYNTFIFLLIVLVFGSVKCLACNCGPPTLELDIVPEPIIENGKYYVCAGEMITFDASASSDDDCGENC